MDFMKFRDKYPYIRDPTYRAWIGARHKCNLSKGAITCDRSWDDFNVFKIDMGVRPEGGALVRRDTSKGYNKENCFWGYRQDYSRQNRQKGTNYGKNT